MANKETNPKTTAKPAATGKSATAKPAASVKQPAAKPAAKPATTAPKSSGIAGSAATKQPAAKPAAKPATAAPKTSGIAGSAATKQPAAKPAAKPATAAPKTSAIAGSAATKQPAAKPAAKPATAAPKTSGIAGSAATKQPAAKPATAKTAQSEPKTAKPAAASKNATVINAAPRTSGIAGSAAAKPATTAPKTSGIAGSAATKQPAPAPAPAPAKTTGSAAQVQKPAAAAAVTAPKGAEKAQPAKPAKQPKQTKAKSAKASGGKGKAVAAIKDNKVRVIIIAAVAFVLVIALVLGIVFGARSCNKGGNDINIPLPDNKDSFNQGGLVNPDEDYKDRTPGEEVFYPDVDDAFSYNVELKTVSEVGFASKVIGEVERNVPDRTRDQGLAAYPKYGYTLSTVIGMGDEQVAARNALIDESDYLTAQGTHNNSGNGNNGAGTYTWMNVDGYLFSGTRAAPVEALDANGNHRRLYKHTASVGLYGGDVSDDEPAIIKTVTMRKRGYSGYGVTGVYAPAGEVIKITVSEADMNATGGLVIHIGQALFNGQSNNIWTAKNQMQRFPNILNTMVLNKNTCRFDEETKTYIGYVGSFVGGPLYIRNTNAETFTATISGGVAYSHFILGYTTKAEFEENAKSSAPYFDLEVWNYGVLHSGPKRQAARYTYEDIYKAAVLWDKVANVSTTNSNQGIVFMYDPFVAAGAAVAFPGRSSVNCPEGWMGGSLNYNGIVTGGSWGNFHEYHHNFQHYGVGGGGEVTNNGMTLVSYALFTKISAKRGISSYGGQGLGGWNNYTSATWALNDLLSIQRGGSPSNGKQGLAIYATLLHNFGPDNYIQAKVTQQKGGFGEYYAGYFRAWEAQTHNNMTYFFKDVLQGLDQATADRFHTSEYTSMFVPVSSVYQTGRSYMYDGVKKEMTTMQPYVIPYGGDFTVDLRKYSAPDGQYEQGSIVIPEGFSYRIKSVNTAGVRGTFTETDVENVYKFTPNATSAFSGKIRVTLEITKDDGAFEVDDVDLILEFEQSHEMNKMTLERTVYTYSADNMYDDATAAYEANFVGYDSVNVKADHTNPTQNCNTDIWFVASGFEERFPNATEDQMMANNNNTVHVIDGKLYFEEEGKYRIFLRGRKNCAVYYSLDGGQTYQFGAKVTNGSGSSFYTTNAETYFDVELGENSWVYVKEVLIVKVADSSYIGLGYGAWTTPLYRMVEKYYDSNGNEVDSPDAENYHHSETVYYDTNNNIVPADVVANAQPTPPTRVSYINAYRCSYVLPDNSSFETDYFYKRNNPYEYSETHNNLTDQAFVGDHGCFYDENRTDFRPEYLFDGDLTTSCSSPTVASPSSPWEFTVDLGKVILANRFVLTGRLNNGAGNQNQTPNSLTLLVGETLDDMKEIANFDNGAVSGITLAFNFDRCSFRYYKLTVRRTVQGRYGAIANIEFSNTIAGASQVSPDSADIVYSQGWEGAQASSTYGHVYVGAKNATAKYKFTGTRVGFITSNAYESNFEVYIDGNKVDSIGLKEDNGAYKLSYLCDALEQGEHEVEFKCTGEASIDSIVVYP